MKEFWYKINKVILGGVTVIVFFFLGFLWWLFSPLDTVPMWLFSLSIIICYTVCVAVYAIASRNIEIIYVLPKVKSIRHTESKIIFLLEKNELFTQGSYVTIAYQDENDQIELILGIGYVETINSQGNMQIVFYRQSEEQEAIKIISKLSDAKFYKNAIKIKPTIQKNFFEEAPCVWQIF